MRLSAFIAEREKRDIIAFFCIGIAAVVAAAWTGLTYFYPATPAPTTSIQDKYRICDNADPSTCPPDAVVVPKGTIKDHAVKNCDDLRKELRNRTFAQTSVHDITCKTGLSNDVTDSQSSNTEKVPVAIRPAVIGPAMKKESSGGLK